MSVLFKKLSPGKKQAQASMPALCAEESMPADPEPLSTLEIQDLINSNELEPIPIHPVEELDELAIEALLDASLLGEAPPLPPELKTNLDLTIRDWNPLLADTGNPKHDIRSSQATQSPHQTSEYKSIGSPRIRDQGRKFSVRSIFRLFGNNR